MSLLTNSTLETLWGSVIKNAEDRCAVFLHDDLEHYLVTLLIRYTNHPTVIHDVIATQFLKAMQRTRLERQAALQNVGDQCLLFAGLFPRLAEKKQVKLTYFVDLGRSAYRSVSGGQDNLFHSLASQFIGLMDVLRSIRKESDLTPIEAYEEWRELGSQHAYMILKEQTNGLPWVKNELK